jgi:hypothetical protein
MSSALPFSSKTGPAGYDAAEENLRSQMGTKQTSRLRIALIGGLTIFVLTVLCVSYSLHPAIRAHYLFSQLESLQLGHSTFEDAQRLASRIGANSTGPCDQSACEWEVTVDNSKLPRWWRGSGEAFLVSFNVENSVVVRKNTGFGVGTKPFFPSQVALIEREHWGRIPGVEPVAAGWKTTDLYRYYEFIVYMTPRASTEDRRRYTAFDYGCLWRYKGCKDARELLPTADPFSAERRRGGTWQRLSALSLSIPAKLGFRKSALRCPPTN